MAVNNKKVLITGGMGNLGSWLTEYFCNKGYDVSVLSRKKRDLTIPQHYRLILCDITDMNDLSGKIGAADYDIILHAASANDAFESQYYHTALMVNTLGTRNLLELLKDDFTGHFIYFSTFQVYGKYKGTIDETSSLTPKNDYGNTHLFAEYYLEQFRQTHHFPFSVIRLTNSYGCPKDFHSSKWYLVLNDLTRTAFQKEEIVLKSNGKASRDFIWMGDVCEIIEKLGKLEPTCDTFNISGEKTFAIRDIAGFVKNAYHRKFGKALPIKINENDDSVPAEMQVKSRKIRELLGYEKYEERFEEESLKILDFLQEQT